MNIITIGCLMVSVFCLQATPLATATEWRSPEALRAFGKPGDTVAGSATATATATEKQNNSTSGYSSDIPPRDSQAYKDYIRKLQQKQAPSRPSYSRSTTSGDENSEPNYSRSTSTGSKEEVWQRCKRGFLDKLENPGSAIFEDNPTSYTTIEPNGTFRVNPKIYAKSGGVLKRFLGICDGNATDYSSIQIRVSVWK